MDVMAIKLLVIFPMYWQQCIQDVLVGLHHRRRFMCFECKRFTHTRTVRDSPQRHDRMESTEGRTYSFWLLITISFVLFALLIANIIPVSSDVNGPVGSLVGSPIVLGFLSLYYLLATKAKDTTWKETFMNELGPVKSGVSCPTFLFCAFLYLRHYRWQ